MASEDWQGAVDDLMHGRADAATALGLHLALDLILLSIRSPAGSIGGPVAVTIVSAASWRSSFLRSLRSRSAPACRRSSFAT